MLTRYDEISIASRVFTLASLLGLSFVSDGFAAVQAVLVVAVVAAMATYVSLATPAAPVWALTGEMLIVGVIIGLTLPGSLILLPYPVVLAALAGLTAGWRGATRVVCAEIAAVIIIPLASTGFLYFPDDSKTLAPWISTSLLIGLVSGLAKRLGHSPTSFDQEDSYTAARRLLTHLHVIARRLSSGLDAKDISLQLLDQLQSGLDYSTAAVYLRTGEHLAPLSHDAHDGQYLLSETRRDLINEAWSSLEPTRSRSVRSDRTGEVDIAFPLRVGPRALGVVICTTTFEEGLTTDLQSHMPILDDFSVRLDSAMLFDEIRAIATTDERQRLAREIHDGIAQDVASLGYLVDSAAAHMDSSEGLANLLSLRQEITRVVGELRYSIFDLRADPSGNADLGRALSDFLRQVEDRSNLRVHLDVAETSARLPPMVELELFRIAQEAVTNARKHAEASNLWVAYRIDPLVAQLVVTDDGTGLKAGRIDSYGLSIMRERAERIGAQLTVEPTTTHTGTRIKVELDTRGILPRPWEATA